MQAAHAGTKTRPHVGIVKVHGGNAYAQTFVIRGEAELPVLSGGAAPVGVSS